MESINSLTQFKNHTIVVADTGDVNLIKKLKPQDATTNPSLLVKSTEQKEYSHFLDEAIDKSNKESEQKINEIYDRLSVIFGKEILKEIEGYVSTEIDPRLSFDTEGSIKRARDIIKLYEEEGINKDRILIKIAATWEGIKAAEVLEKDGIHCNLTLIFTLAQAIACADAGITLISPFVGRINDGYQVKYSKTYKPEEEPGVLLVKDIFNYYKKFGYKTIVMAASLRTPESAFELSGVDRMTIPPSVIEKMGLLNIRVEKKLNPEEAEHAEIKKINMNEKVFRWMLNEDEIGNEKLADGIRQFAKDTLKLEKIIIEKLK